MLHVTIHFVNKSTIELSGIHTWLKNKIDNFFSSIHPFMHYITYFWKLSTLHLTLKTDNLKIFFSLAWCVWMIIYLKGVVSSYQIRLILLSVAEADPKLNQSWCNLQFSICRHAGEKVLSLKNQDSLFWDILFASITRHGPMDLLLLLIIS